MRQVEVSRTIVSGAPRRARGFSGALVAGNPGTGRPHNVEIIFARKVRRDTKGAFRTAAGRRDNGGAVVNVSCKHSRIKQYLKDGRAMRTGTVASAPATWAATPACPPGRPAGQSPCRQQAHTGSRACRPGHRPCGPGL